VLGDLGTSADVERRMDVAVGIGFDRDRNRVGAIRVDEMGQGYRADVGERPVATVCEGAGEIRLLVPQIRCPRCEREQMADGILGGDLDRIGHSPEPGLGEVAGEDPGVVAEAVNGG
jgi:hypothetical protein